MTGRGARAHLACLLGATVVGCTLPARTATLERDHARLAAQVAALQARHAFEKVIADAPASSDAVKARARLADLDRSAH